MIATELLESIFQQVTHTPSIAIALASPSIDKEL